MKSPKEFRLNRLFSVPLTRLLLKTPLTPNQVTGLSMGFGLAAAFLFSKGTYWDSVAAAFLYQAACLLDNCDGEIARAKNLSSRLGEWLDIAADLVTDAALFTGIAFGMFRQQAEGLPANASVAGPVTFFLVLCLSGALGHFALVVLEKRRGFGPAVFEKAPRGGTPLKNALFILFDCLREGEGSWFVIAFALLDKMPYLLWFGGVYMQILWISALILNFRRLANP